jgi:4a-hydroxytetrahydrobiopterin dehydratase
MDEHTILTGSRLEEAVRSLNVAWAVLPGRGLVRVVPTNAFSAGFQIVAAVAKTAEEQGFEPEVTLRRDEVEISLPAYEHGGVSERDVAAAAKIDDVL